MISTVEKYYIDVNGTLEWQNTYIVTYVDGFVNYVPHSEENRHYQEILEWVAEGNTITDNGGSE